MSLAYPLLLLAPFPLLLLFVARRRSSSAVPYPSLSLLKGLAPSLRQRLRRPVLASLTTLFLVLLGIAAARPQIIDTVTLSLHSRNLILALDLSPSMGTEDFSGPLGRASRLDAVKAVVAEFIKNRPTDRIGIVVFGKGAFLQAPLTLDHNLLVDMVKRLEIGIAGEGTAIGDGLGLSVKRIADLPGESKAIILLTDGVNTAGEVNPLKAAGVAADLGIKVHTIGVGSRDMRTRTLPGTFGARTVTAVEFDEETLRAIADITKGVYFNAANLDELRKVYRNIDRLEKTVNDDPRRRAARELFHYAGLAAFLGYGLYLLLARGMFMKVPT